jgi:hypothetical protein
MLWWGSACWAIALICLDASDRAQQQTFLNSDQLYIPALVEDLLRWSGSLEDWYFTPSPYFFPDALLYAGARVFGASIEWASYIAGILQFLAIAFAGRMLLVRGLRWSAPIASLVAPAFPLMLLLHPALQFVKPLFVISTHGAAVWMSFITLGLCLSEREPSTRLWTSASVVLATLFGFSDPLYTVTCSGPLAALALVRLLRVRFARGSLASPLRAGRALFTATGALTGMGILLWTSRTTVSAEATNLDLESSTLTLERMNADLLGVARNELVLSGLIALTGVITIVALWRRDEDAPLRWFAAWCLLSLAGSYVAMVLSGHYVDIHSFRYMVVPWTAGVFLIAVAVVRLARSTITRARNPSWLRAAAAAVLVGLTSTLVTRGASIAHGQYDADMRQKAECVQRVAHREGSAFVVAEYWTAKPLLLFSNGALRVVQVEVDPFRPRLWINSKGWYRGLTDQRWSVLVSNGLPLDKLSRYGRPATFDDCDGLNVLGYRGRVRRKIAGELKAGLQTLTAE